MHHLFSEVDSWKNIKLIIFKGSCVDIAIIIPIKRIIGIIAMSENDP